MNFNQLPVGYRGQRYQFMAKDADGEEFTLGWSNNPEEFKSTVELHPVWTEWRCVDIASFDLDHPEHPNNKTYE